MTCFMLFDQIYNLENLYCAWKKVRNIYYNELDFIFDIIELAEFEVNLENNLEEISEEIKDGKYRLSDIIPLWLPKASLDPESRQHFHFSVKDQVTWMAVINIIGPTLDDNMPYWSFGNRLYMPIWKEDNITSNQADASKKITRYGSYCSSSPKLYRNWSVSWPLFRKAVSISVKAMTMSRNNQDKYSDDELEDINSQENAPSSFKIACWEKNYWKHKPNETRVFYASIDLSKFYPSIDHDSILNPEAKRLLNINNNDSPLVRLLETLLDFKINPNALMNLDPDDPIVGINENNGTFSGIPTGLFVAGFLANIAMMPIDKEVYQIQNNLRRIGHFRFVDDHVFITYNFDELCNWMDQYKKIIEKHLPDLKINDKKTEPAALGEYLNANSLKGTTEMEKAKRACELDVQLPSPFTTLTIRKLSNISASPFDLLDEAGKNNLLNDIEHILATEFPDDEIRKDTRVSWSASILIHLVPSIQSNVKELYDKRRTMELAFSSKPSKAKKGNQDEEKTIEYETYKEQINKQLSNTYRHIYTLLIKALSDNLAKPKLWRKCVSYCCATGFSGIPRLIKLLENSTSLTTAGKSYVYCTLLSAITSNIVHSINTIKSEYFNDKEKNNAHDFVKAVCELQQRIIESGKQYHSEHVSRQQQQYKMALTLYHLECKNEKPDYHFNHTVFCFLWIYMPTYIRHSSKTETPVVATRLFENIESNIGDSVYKKLLLMYPDKLNNNLRRALFGYSLSPKSTRRRKIKMKCYISLQTLFISDELLKASSEHTFYIPHSEWTALSIMQKVLDLISQKNQREIFSLTDLQENCFEFINCAPCNFYIDQDISNCRTWNEISTFLEEHDIEYRPICSDYRFETSFYNQSGIANEKSQVYSCAALLITLLSKSMEFNPLIGRSNRFDRNYKLLLEKIKDAPISSYTQAILVGAMSDKWFEMQNCSCLDVRSEDRSVPLDLPIEIETINVFTQELVGAILTLKKYQLSLQDQVPRQLVPITLINLTKENNPYSRSGKRYD